MLKIEKFLLFFVLIFCISYNSFADVVRNNIISKIYEETQDKYDIEDQTNGVLDTITSFMTPEDNEELRTLVVKYFAGEKELLDDMIPIVAKYTQNPVYVLNYVLFEKSVSPVARFLLVNGELVPAPLVDNLLTSYFKEDDLTKVLYIWERLKHKWPEEDLKHIAVLQISKNKQTDTLVAISPFSDDNKENLWVLDLDENLFFYDDELDYNLNIALAFYYALNMDNVIDEGTKIKNTYSLRGLQYSESSPINKFYKKFWKGRKIEYDINQLSKYSNNFFNEKASRTCYDDFAISFLEYALKGKNSATKTVLIEKLKFFDDISEYKALAHWIKARNN